MKFKSFWIKFPAELAGQEFWKARNPFIDVFKVKYCVIFENVELTRTYLFSSVDAYHSRDCLV